MTLKQLRKEKKLTQVECAKFLGIPLRTYQNYEAVDSKADTIKYDYMMQKLSGYGLINETHGILTIAQIKETCTRIFENYDVDFCYLFGSYAKSKATDTSDVDLLVSTTVSGIKYYDLVEALREGLKKKVDVLNTEQLNGNSQLLDEILKHGVKIYG